MGDGAVPVSHLSRPAECAMARIDAILKLVKEQGASDLHMTTDRKSVV